MFLKKPLLIQNINPRTVFTIIVWLSIAWIFARPLKGTGELIYRIVGAAANNTFQGLLQSKTIADELIKSNVIANEQSKTISLLKIKINSLEDQLKEAKNLKSILSIKKQIRYKTTATKVIGRSPDNWHKQIILDKGENYLIMTGDSVLTKNGVVGQIVDVDKNTSVVQLISDPSFKLGCKVLKKNIIGILSGKTNSIGILEFIPAGTDITAGDVIVASGIRASDLPPSYPSGHPVGKVIKVSKKKSKASDLYIEVKLSENLNTLNNVLVFSPN